MSSKLEIVDQLVLGFGKDTDEVRRKVETAVGDVTIDILSQNDGRFNGLRRKQSITVLSGKTEYRLTADFNTFIVNCQEVDVDGNMIGEFTVTDEIEFVRRNVEGRIDGTKFAWIEYKQEHADGPGYYLVLATDWKTTGYIKFYYYRRPTKDDTELIKNDAVVKEGARSKFPQYIGREEAILAGQTYHNMKRGVKESPSTLSTGIMVLPSKYTRQGNRFRKKIGRGQ